MVGTMPNTIEITTCHVHILVGIMALLLRQLLNHLLIASEGQSVVIMANHM